jgi:replication gene A protein
MRQGRTYREYVTPPWQYLRCDASRAMFGGAPTPLHEIVAPDILKLPRDIGAQLARDFWKRHGDKGDWARKYEAQAWLANEVEGFQREKIHRAFDEHEIRALAKRWAELCGKMQSLEVMQDFGRSVGINPPEVKRNVSRVGAARRMACARWWRRQIRKAYTRRAETHLRAAGFVHRRRQVYASDRAVQHRRERKQRDRAMLQELVAVSDAGDQLELWSVVEKSQANPALRRAELMTRLSGFEEVSKVSGHEALFITLTTPSAYHCTLDNGQKNPKWEGFTPRHGQEWMCKMWARSRSKLKRISASYYGFRIAEPHHDATPHWHMVLFGTAAALEKVREVLRLAWLSEYADEAGAAKYRVKFERIRPEAGSATGYLAKYVAKNIDGFEVGEDYETNGQQATESCDRVAAWASAHSIRQFQQIGGPSVTVWRELRRLRSAVLDNETIEAARQAADAGEWANFVAALGGIERGRGGSVGIWCESTGELNQYDELRAPQIAGVQCAGDTLQGSAASRPLVRVTGTSGKPGDSGTGHIRIRTRCKVWRIERKAPVGNPEAWSGGSRAETVACTGGSDARASSALSGPVSSLGPVSITVRGLRTMPAGGVAGNPENRGPPWPDRMH